jgi:hypothetical protein
VSRPHSIRPEPQPWEEVTLGSPSLSPPLEVIVDSLPAEPERRLQAPCKKLSGTRSMLVNVVGHRLAPNGSCGFSPEASPPKVSPSIESP